MPGHSHMLQSERSALETMQRLEGILASAMDAIITVNDQQRVVVFNPAAERMFGLPSSEALGEHISRFIPLRHHAAHAEHIQRFIETGDTNRQMGSLGAVSGLRASGEEFPIEASISQAQIGDERLATVILRDITERRAAEEAVLESRRRMQAIVESAMDALITVDERQHILVFNPAAERMFGVAASDAIGSPIERFVPERFRAGHGRHIDRFKEAGMTNRRMGALGAVSALRANGEEFPVEASISQVKVGGATLGTVILRDITERRANEEARDLLAREVDHRAKNALAVVQAVISLTRAASKEAFVTAVRGRISALGRAHSLLAQNRWQGGDLAQIVMDEMAGYGRDGHVEITGPSVALRPNAVQPISLLVHELATNAVKYGALSVEGGRVRVAWTLRRDGALGLVWEEQGGPPVAAPGSPGFGSTLVREVATRQLAGELDIQWPATGMRLTAILPQAAHRSELSGAGSVSPEAADDVVGASPRRGRLLVVEDEALVAMAVAQDLTNLGWDILGPAASIEEAHRLLTAGPLPDAAVLDVNLSGDLVYPLAEWLRAQQVPFVFCTGYEQLESHPAYEQWPRVRKPVDVQLLDTELLRAREAA
ncbi:PAS domain S-box protein [Phenylobacterium sp. SCN 70-31]|uniref:PAS domain S-box protein n=1 Tax=Phenylobacterium sp. SCN 70-31 TaxID=1660129 RepID=UPI00086BEEDC|nr:PAS domain S-box protein [Phenylobacterium sp. SCN 70-31]ODT89634.1 MAG: response regulator receiver protein [Phenylobacterium sp. SCN 70-31]